MMAIFGGQLLLPIICEGYTRPVKQEKKKKKKEARMVLRKKTVANIPGILQRLM